ncbi:MAG: hypothetical protein VW405_07375 [Rhodospirillaceae bacterium]
MARIRFIKPELFDDVKLGTMPPLARLLFIGLWTLADREGRLEDEPQRIKVRVLPYDHDCNIDALLDTLCAAGCIQRYVADGKRVLAVSNFTKHQRPHPKEPPSLLGKPPEVSRGKTRRAVEKHGEDTPCREKNSTSRVDSGFLNTDSGVLILEEGRIAADASLPPPPDAVLLFPCQGAEPSWPLTAPQVASWQQLYPDLDILAECRQALAYVTANGRKTARGMPAFLVNWFNRSARMGAKRAP